MTWKLQLERLGGAASLTQLRAAGATEHGLRVAVARGELRRPRNGRYVSSAATEPMLSAVRAGARLSCVSAARSYGLWAGVDRRTHVVVPPNAGRSVEPNPLLVRHWRRCDDHPEIWRVSLADCLRTVVRCADPETALAALDTSLASGQTTLAGLQRMFSEEPRRCRALAARARPGSDSGVESILRQRLEARGHVVEQQVFVPGVGRVDARVDGMLFVEVDGFRFHGDAASFERDRDRDAALTVRGARHIRLSARQIIDDPQTAVGTIEAVLELLETEVNRGGRAA